MKSGVQRILNEAVTAEEPGLNAMKSGVQLASSTPKSLKVLWFECDEERSATSEFALCIWSRALFECDEERSATNTNHGIPLEY